MNCDPSSSDRGSKGERNFQASWNSRVSSDSQCLRLLDAVRRGDEDAVQCLLDDGANIRAKNIDGETALHDAVRNGSLSMVQLLLDRGVDAEVADSKGAKALYIAAETGDLELVELLLRFDVDVESFNPVAQSTAFHQAVICGHPAVAGLLLAKGADIDALVRDGHTPLLNAVIRNDLQAVEFLLQNGANKKLRDDDGRRIEDFAVENPAMLALLQSDQLLQGPAITGPKTSTKRQIRIPPLSSDQPNKLKACQGFEGTIVDFFVGATEQRIEKTVPIYELLYGKGPDSIMDPASRVGIDGQQPIFRWYHLPANNIEWVHILVNRHFSNRSSGATMLDEEFKSKLALSNSTLRQYRVSTKHCSFMRPQCRVVKLTDNEQSSPDSDPNDEIDNIVLFPLIYLHIPFLHFETSEGYHKMARFLKALSEQFIHQSQPAPSLWRPSRQPKKRPRERTLVPSLLDPLQNADPSASAITSSDSSASDSTQRTFTHTQGKLRSAFENLADVMRRGLHRGPKTKASSSGHEDDIEKGDRPGGDTKGFAEAIASSQRDQLFGPTSSSNEKLTAENEAATVISNAESTKASKMAGNDRGKTGNSVSPSEKPSAANNTAKTAISNVRSSKNSQMVDSNSEKLANSLSLSEKPGSEGERAETVSLNIESTKTSPMVDNTSGSLGRSPPPTVPAVEENTEGSVASQQNPSQRSGRSFWGLSTDDVDNLNFRAEETAFRTRNGGDQTADLMNIDEHLVKGYFSPSNPGDSPLQLRRTLDQYFYTHLAHMSERNTGGQVIQRYTQEHFSEPKMWMVDQLWLWILNNAIQRKDKERGQFFPTSSRDHLETVFEPYSPRSSSEENRQRRAFLRKDPLNVHQTILKHLQSRARDPITSVYALATLIADTCIELFDEYRVPDEFQFFDFFERSIGDVIDQETQCFQSFAKSLNNKSPRETDAVFSITKEATLLAEIKDISDELGILKMVLHDQQEPREILAQTIARHRTKDTNVKDKTNGSPWTRNTVLGSHLSRIKLMESLAERSYQALYNLLDLKQKQANALEALSSRKQAENTFAQAEATQSLTEESLKLAQYTHDQSREATRQGRTVLLFTVVTIIFLPLSFISAFFAINIDVFPWTSSGRLPLDYILKYLFGISSAVSIPFILIAFNQDRIAQWLKYARGVAAAGWAFLLAAMVAILAVIWTQSLATGIKAAVTIVIICAILVVLIVYTWHRLFGSMLNFTPSSDVSSRSLLSKGKYFN
uniref:Ankyrin repeat and SOCS box protein 10 n=1 Tax=Coccidioides posadasii RMSCC 3488 TaxID=454284 RepID=A0A0J6IGH7_COCPO|nr:ankyrin repeat and SOCS box protein 10 [Coccidioides posadasii RMSCC 3488]